MNHRLYTYIIWLIILFAKSGYGSPSKNNYSSLSVKDGLSNGWITAITQDKHGFMWFATTDGLNKYDGKSFTIYRQQPDDTTSLWSNFISCMLEDSKDNIWIGTNTGLNKLNLKTNKMTRIWLDREYNITSLSEINQNQIAFTTYNGLFILNTLTHNIYRYKIDGRDYNSPWNRFKCMTKRNNQLLMASDGGVYSFDIESAKFELIIPNNPTFNAANVRTMYIHEDILWLGMTNDGLYSYPINSKHTSPTKIENDLLKNTTIFSFYPLKENIILIGTENQGYFSVEVIDSENHQYKTQQYINNFYSPKNLINNSVHSIFKDQQDILWIGTYNGISYQYSKGLNFNAITHQASNPNSLSNSMVNTIIELNDRLWVGTENGIDVFSKDEIKLFHISSKDNNKLQGRAIMSMETDSDGNIWVGSWSGGIDIFNNEGVKIKSLKESETGIDFSNHSVMKITKDWDGKMWVGSMGEGITIFHKGQNKQYKNEQNNKFSLSNDWIRDILISSRNEVWIATHAGLNLFNKETETFINFSHSSMDSNTIAGSDVECMHEDIYGNLWFGTPLGLSLFNRKDSSFTNYFTSSGLPNNHIQSIISDSNGDLWIGTNAGLSKLSNNNKVIIKPKFTNYDLRDGLLDNFFIRKAVYISKNNTLYFGTKEGLIHFNPDHIQENTFIPNVYLTNIKINNLDISKFNKDLSNPNFVKKLDLAHNESDLSFEFCALNFIVSGKNQYKYILEGFDKSWRNIDNQASATYTNIPSGDYVFKVKGSNNSGLWNENETKIFIHIAPPWYQTKLAYLVFLTFIFLLILSYRHFIVVQTNLESKLKVEKIENESLNHMNKIKTRFFTNISHEFLTPLSLIISPLETIINNNDLSESQISRLNPIYRNAKRLQRLINQLLDISKIEADHIALRVAQANIENFIQEIYFAFKSLAENKGINFIFTSKVKNNRITYFDHDKIEKITYNLLSNAIKFTPTGGEVNLTLSQDDTNIIIEVSDTGAGINEDELSRIYESFFRSKDEKKNLIEGTGIGLSLVKGLVNVYQGKLDLISKVSEGTTFTVHLPYTKEAFKPEHILNKTEETITMDIIEEANDNKISESLEPNISNESLPSILIVEDNNELNEHLVDLLKKQYNVYSSFNGIQGFERTLELMPDLIITDIKMPKMNGIELLQKIKTSEPISHIPVILLTAKIDIENKIEGIEMGADAYITKPFDKLHLESTIANLIKSRAKLKDIYKKNIVIEPTQINITSVDEKFITKAIKLVEENISNPNFTVEILASEIGMSRVQLHRKLTALLEMSASNFIREIKIKRAADLLTKGQLTVSEVMYEVNIKSRAYFTKCFKEKFNMLPMEYVKAFKEEFK